MGSYPQTQFSTGRVQFAQLNFASYVNPLPLIPNLIVFLILSWSLQYPALLSSLAFAWSNSMLMFQASLQFTLYNASITMLFKPTRHSRSGRSTGLAAVKNLLTGLYWSDA